MGNRNNPFYRLVVADSRARRDGPSVEVLGFYKPVREPAEFSIKEDRALHWLQQGARMSDTVKSLFKRQGILEKFTGVAYASLKTQGEPISKKAKKRGKEATRATDEKPDEEAQAEAPAAEQAPQEQEPGEKATASSQEESAES